MADRWDREEDYGRRNRDWDEGDDYSRMRSQYGDDFGRGYGRRYRDRGRELDNIDYDRNFEAGRGTRGFTGGYGSRGRDYDYGPRYSGDYESGYGGMRGGFRSGGYQGRGEYRGGYGRGNDMGYYSDRYGAWVEDWDPKEYNGYPGPVPGFGGYLERGGRLHRARAAGLPAFR